VHRQVFQGQNKLLINSCRLRFRKEFLKARIIPDWVPDGVDLRRTSQISNCAQFLEWVSEMRNLAIFAVAIMCFVDLSSCSTTRFAPPPVTVELTRAETRQHADIGTLRKGRALFVHRCIECHTLPPFWHYRTEDWPEIVNSMSHRASLKPAERDAIIAYILAVRFAEQVNLAHFHR
jgi:hypothetical protein